MFGLTTVDNSVSLFMTDNIGLSFIGNDRSFPFYSTSLGALDYYRSIYHNVLLQ